MKKTKLQTQYEYKKKIYITCGKLFTDKISNTMLKILLQVEKDQY